MVENIEDLRGYLFRMLKKLEDASADELEDESARAKSMTGIARILVETGRIEKMPGHGRNGDGVFFQEKVIGGNLLGGAPNVSSPSSADAGEIGGGEVDSTEEIEMFDSAKHRTSRITRLLSEGYKMVSPGAPTLRPREMTTRDRDGVYHLRISSHGRDDQAVG